MNFQRLEGTNRGEELRKELEDRSKPFFSSFSMPSFKPSTEKQIEAYKLLSLGGGVFILMLYSLMGTKYGIIRKPRLITNHYYLLSLPFFGAYIYYINAYVSSFSGFFLVFIVLVVPYLILIFDMALLIISEGWKEHKLYERLTKTFSGDSHGRWGGILTNWKFDITNIFDASRGQKIKKTKYSPVLIGKTILEYDHMIRQRYIGTTSEQHLITIAGTGAGKSYTSITSNILSYCGGMLILDVKAEHTKNAYKRRSEYAPCYVVDPYNIAGDEFPNHIWNPLDEIDPNDPNARGYLKRVAEALVMKETGSRENPHFREIPQKLLRGFIAHVLTAYPEEERHLGTVYDIILEGKKSVVDEMEKNEAIGGAPKEAALEIKNFSERSASDQRSSLMRAVDWMNDPMIRKSYTGKSDFSLRDCKTKDATVFFVIRKDRLQQVNRYIRLFYTLGFDVLDENKSALPEGSERRVLMIMDEFEALGHFDIVREGFLRARSAYIKIWVVLQNLGRLKNNYPNYKDFTTNADLQIFGISSTDEEVRELIQEALGKYENPNEKTEDNKPKEKPLMSTSAINGFLNAKGKGQIFIPLLGLPMRLNRIPFVKLFRKKYYGSR